MSEAKLTSGCYHWVIPGDVVVNPLLPEEKGIILGFTGSGKVYIDVLMRKFGNYSFIVVSYPIDEIEPTGEHINISPLVNWFKD